MSDHDHYRGTRPMGRPFDGTVPRYRSAGNPDPESNPYPFAYPNPRPRQPNPSHVARTLAPAPTPPQPSPVYPPEPFISQMETARNTRQIASEIRQIKWIILMVFLAALVLVSTEFFIAVRISSIITLTYSHF